MLDNKLKVNVQQVLEKHPDSRDNDEALLIRVWWLYNPKLLVKPHKYLFKDFAKGFLQGIYPKAESIRRVRQALQQHNESLRGTKYRARHGYQEIVKEELRKFNEV